MRWQMKRKPGSRLARAGRWGAWILAACVVLFGAGACSLTLGQPPSPTATFMPPPKLSPTTPSCETAASAPNPITAENMCPGTDKWRITATLGPESAMEGFVAPASVNVGESVRLYANTSAPTYSFAVYRMGWYQGHGARLMYTSVSVRGIRQPDPLFDHETRTVSASNWLNPVTIDTESG
jgi:hypothetical protein